MTSNLNEIFGLNQYCGPSVLSALTGRSTDSCAAAIAAVSGARVVKAVQITHLVEAAKRLGFLTDPIPVPARSLFGVISAIISRDGFYIVMVPNHVVAVEIKEKTAFFIDNNTKRAINAAASARLTQEVIKVWQIKPKPEPTAEEIERNRVTWLQTQINILNSTIGRAVKERERYVKELESLQGGKI